MHARSCILAIYKFQNNVLQKVVVCTNVSTAKAGDVIYAPPSPQVQEYGDNVSAFPRFYLKEGCLAIEPRHKSRKVLFALCGKGGRKGWRGERPSKYRSLQVERGKKVRGQGGREDVPASPTTTGLVPPSWGGRTAGSTYLCSSVRETHSTT